MIFELRFIVSVAVAAIVSFGVMMMFAHLISAIFGDIFQGKLRLNSAFIKYIKCATLLVGISQGATLFGFDWSFYETIKDLVPNLDFNRVSWLTATYATIIETLRALAYMYSALFIIILIAYVIVTSREKSDT